MSGWRTDMENAPRSEIVEREVERGGKTIKVKRFDPKKVIAWRAGSEPLVTWFLPRGVEGAEGGERWNFFSADHPPTHWMPYPSAPELS